MGRVKDVIDKYGLRDICAVRGVEGQKMDETCIQAFIDGDPSGNGKYLDWMFLQAGGGSERFEKSVTQWEKGDHGEEPVRLTLRKKFIEDSVAGYTDETGKRVAPVTEAVAELMWEESGEQMYRNYHIYGDEEYVVTGFGFYRSWPGNNSLYEHIVQAVQRFHRYQQKLKSSGKSIDLNEKNYPNLRDLQEALGDITFLEIKNHLDHDIVFEDENLVIVCPFNIGSSLKFGHQKWCTANETMFKTACSGHGPNRWKEYAKDSALYYCRFSRRNVVETEIVKGAPSVIEQIAIQAAFKSSLSSWKFFDTSDASHNESEIGGMIATDLGFQAIKSWRAAIDAVTYHFKRYPKTRLNLEFVVKS